MNAKITALGANVPERIVTNEDMSKIVDTSDEWITKRTGIKERHYIGDDQTIDDLCENAVKELLEHHKEVSLKDVDFIIVASSTAERRIPSVASQMQYRFDIPGTGCIDIVAACAGFVYGLTLAKSLIASGEKKKILVIGSDVLTHATNFEDRTTCVLFGDGAGAALVEASDEEGILKSVNGTEGWGASALYCTGNPHPINGAEVIANGKIYQDGRKVFKWAVERVSQQFGKLLEINNLTMDEIDYFVPHSANKRIIEAICENIGYPYEKSLRSIEMFGNTSAGSIPLAVWNALRNGTDLKDKNVLMIGFGAGLTFGGTIVKWRF